MAGAFRTLRTNKRNSRSRWLIASVSFHVLAFAAFLAFADIRPHGRGLRSFAEDEAFSVTWIPGGGGGKSGLDTVVDGADPELEVEAPASPQTPAATPAAFSPPKTDPQMVFNATSNEPLALDAAIAGKTTSNRQPTTDDVRPRETFRDQSDETDARKSISGSGSDRDDEKPTRRGHGTGTGHGSSETLGRNQIQFFGILARATRVVYVIDASDSMRKHSAMEIARDELFESLHGLEPAAQFQIVFFDVDAHWMDSSSDKPKLLRATSSNVRLAERFAKGIQPDAGTNRFAALTRALSFDPDVIFLLTDADDPEISAQELWEIRRSNKKKTTIHVIEFGLGADLSRDSFLKKLARQNDGRHEYRDLRTRRGSEG